MPTKPKPTVRKALGVTAAQIQRMEKDQLERRTLRDAERRGQDQAHRRLRAAASAYVAGIGQVVESIQMRDKILAERINRVAP